MQTPNIIITDAIPAISPLVNAPTVDIICCSVVSESVVCVANNSVVFFVVESLVASPVGGLVVSSSCSTV